MALLLIAIGTARLVLLGTKYTRKWRKRQPRPGHVRAQAAI